jgi:sortase A
MNDFSTRLFKLSKLETVFSARPAVWRTISLMLTIGGLILLGYGSWMFYEQYRDLIGPPPARIVEVSVADLPSDPPAAPPAIAASPGPETSRNQIVFASVTPTGPASTPTASPTPKATLASQLTATAIKAAGTPLPTPSDTPKAAATKSSSAPTGAKPGPSLADNPLVMVEDEALPAGPAEAPARVPSFPHPAKAVTRIVAESIELDSEVIKVGWQTVIQNGVQANVWAVADYAAGWHENSTLPGQGGNVVLSGHHNINGEVFRYIVDLEPGAIITLYDGDEAYNYAVEDKFIVKDKDEPEAVRRENAKWIGPFNEERLTLVTCWPYTNNTHRVIVIAKPAPQD